MIKYALYRVLYGQFITESIESIYDEFDKIFVFFDVIPWGNIEVIKYKNEDRFVDDILDIHNDNFRYGKSSFNFPDPEFKINAYFDHVENNINQITHLVNDLILTNHSKPDLICFIEPDHIFPKSELKKTIKFFEEFPNIRHAATRQIEFWKTLDLRIPERPLRLSTIWWNMKELDKLPETGRHGEYHPWLHKLDTFVLNLGFCVEDREMFLKHLLALGFAQKIGDSLPNENWFEEKWLNWDYHRNNSNLEMSTGYEHTIPRAELLSPELQDFYLNQNQIPESILNYFYHLRGGIM